MAEYKLTVAERTVAGKKLAPLRAAGQIPSVIYGGKKPVLGQSAYVATEKILEKAGYHSPIMLDLAGKPQLVIVKDVQLDPVSRNIINIEFQAISAKEAVEAVTPVTIINFDASDASKNHHYELNQSVEEIAIKAKPADLPSDLTLDASKLAELTDKLTVADLELPKGVELANAETDPELVIASLYDPAAEAAAREAAAVTEESGEETAETSESEAAPATEE